jgi:hypothetical protein
VLEVVPTLQLAIGPVILISGIGLILLSMTNRFGRVIDRSRLLVRELREASDADRPRLLEELRILATRARRVRAGITCGILTALLAALLTCTLFVGALLRLNVAAMIVVIFATCMLSLISCLLLFVSDINLSLHALWLEIPPDVRTGQHSTGASPPQRRPAP